jgi:MFS family permease
MASMYMYYATVYSAIQDVIEPGLRGTAMALYFFAMYVLGASLGPVGMGFLSSYFTRQAALNAGVTETTFRPCDRFAAEGFALGTLTSFRCWRAVGTGVVCRLTHRCERHGETSALDARVCQL